MVLLLIILPYRHTASAGGINYTACNISRANSLFNKYTGWYGNEADWYQMNDSGNKYLHAVTFYCAHSQVAPAATINSSDSYTFWGGTYPAISTYGIR